METSPIDKEEVESYYQLRYFGNKDLLRFIPYFESKIVNGEIPSVSMKEFLVLRNLIPIYKKLHATQYRNKKALDNHIFFYLNKIPVKIIPGPWIIKE